MKHYTRAGLVQAVEYIARWVEETNAGAPHLVRQYLSEIPAFLKAQAEATDYLNAHPVAACCTSAALRKTSARKVISRSAREWSSVTIRPSG